MRRCTVMLDDMFQRAAVGLVVAAVLAAPVAAQPAPAPPAAPEPEPGHPAIALGLSLAAPVLVIGSGAVLADGGVVGSALLLGGLSIAPAAGWFYAKRPWHGAATSLTRLVSGTVVLAAFDSEDGGPSEEVVTACALIVLGTTLYDLLGPGAALSADRARWRERRALVVPTATGLALVGSF